VASTLTVRFRVDFGNGSSIGIGKIELLEGIGRTGSLSQAAREMRMSYRRAWLLLEDLNTSFDRRVSQASVGGRGGGGATLTAFGSSLVAGYRRLDARMQPVAQSCLEDFGRHIKSAASKRHLRATSIKRKSPQRKPV
jgi:molybdate transport system regulatory protein